MGHQNRIHSVPTRHNGAHNSGMSLPYMERTIMPGAASDRNRGDIMAANENHAQSLESFETIALPHRGDLYRSAVAMLSRRVEAEDMVQEVYLQAWKSFH